MSIKNQILKSKPRKSFIQKMNYKWQEKYKREQLFLDEIDKMHFY